MTMLNFRNFNKTKIISKIGFFWEKIHKALFFFLLFASIFFGGYIWSLNLYGSTWTNERRQVFVNMQDKGVVFNESAYQKALEIVERRKQLTLEEKKLGGIDFFNPR